MMIKSLYSRPIMSGGMNVKTEMNASDGGVSSAFFNPSFRKSLRLIDAPIKARNFSEQE